MAADGNRPTGRIKPLSKVARPSLGDVALIESSPYFDAAWYVERHDDPALSGMSAAEHYLWVGAAMGRDPSRWFSGGYYLDQNPAVAARGMNPLVHFLRHGLRDGEQSRPDGLRPPLPKARPDHPLRGPLPYLGAHLDSELVEALDRDGLTHAPWRSTLALADQILASQSTPRVSVILPYGGASFVKALNSLLNQSHPADEILLVFDAAETAALSGIRRAHGDLIAAQRLRLIPQEGRGPAAAHVTGLDAATGDLISYLDGDSIWRPEHLKLMVAWFAECDALMLGHATWLERGVGQPAQKGIGALNQRALLMDPDALSLCAVMHRRSVLDQLGGPDQTMGEGALWDMLLRVSDLYPPVRLPVLSVETQRTVALSPEIQAPVIDRHRQACFRHGTEAPRIAYILWDWPALSQTFVMGELIWLVERGFDVEVFYKIAPDRAATVPIDIPQHQVSGPEDLAPLLRERNRTLAHCHFAYAATTLLAWPACQQAGIPFTFCAHAVDVFLHNNIARNRIEEVMADPLCLKCFVPGEFHRHHLEAQNIPIEKLAYTLQAVDLSLPRGIPDRAAPASGAPVRGAFIARFVDKKGIHVLIEAAGQLRDTQVHFDIHGYGPLEQSVKARVAELGLENITFHGPLDSPYAVRDALEAADFFIAPSIVADHGDTEGFPTIVLEAMAARRPVVTTAVSSLGEFLADGVEAHIAQPGDATDLAGKVRATLAMTPLARTTMLRNACDFLARTVGVDRTMQAYCDQWFATPVEIVLITQNTPKDNRGEDAFEIIRRLRAHTTTPYRLTVVDIGSEPAFRDQLQALAQRVPLMRLHLLGPDVSYPEALNLALAGSDAVYAIHVCARSGFVARHGWERPLIDQMRHNPRAAMGGHLASLPRHTFGSELSRLPGFAAFRNRAFAALNPSRIFRHVQGGLFILRRDVVDAKTGFTPGLKDGQWDVEFSYYLESEGHALTHIPQVAALTKERAAGLDAVLDEQVFAAHPLDLESVVALDRVHVPGVQRCNLCQAWEELDKTGLCGNCHSSGMDRKLWQMLNEDWHLQRGGQALLIDAVGRLAKSLRGQRLDVVETTWRDLPQDGAFAMICTGTPPTAEQAVHLLDMLAPGGLMLWPENPQVRPDQLVGLDPDLRGGARQRLSRVLRTDPRRLYWVTRDL